MKSILTLLIFMGSIWGSASSLPPTAQNDSLKYQLVLIDQSDDQETEIPVGHYLICTDQGGRRYQGEIRGYSDDAILLKEEMVMMKNVQVIKAFPKKEKARVKLGGLLKALALVLVLFPFVLLATATQDPTTTRQTAIVSYILAPIFALSGYLIGKTKKFHLKKRYKWRMDRTVKAKKP